MSNRLLEVKNLVTHFNITNGIFGRTTGVVHAVDDVSFVLNRAETLSIVGESGCGKSTTGRSILKLIPMKSGKIIFMNEDTSSLSSTEMQKMRVNMQMIFQDPFSSLNPRLTIGSAIAEPLKRHKLFSGKDLKDKVNELLVRVGLLPENANRYPHEFSGGQRQRICIARALGPKPALIVADEAVSALDVTIQAQIINLMMDLQDEFEISFLFISHDMAVVERISHKVAVMYLGRIVEIGSRIQVFENPSHPYTNKLLNAVPVADPNVVRKSDGLLNDEVPSPIKPVGYSTPPVKMEEVEMGHFVSLN
jgi:ABC-type oligopeptide transport system ATPase subunit